MISYNTIYGKTSTHTSIAPSTQQIPVPLPGRSPRSHWQLKPRAYAGLSSAGDVQQRKMAEIFGKKNIGKPWDKTKENIERT